MEWTSGPTTKINARRCNDGKCDTVTDITIPHIPQTRDHRESKRRWRIAPLQPPSPPPHITSPPLRVPPVGPLTTTLHSTTSLQPSPLRKGPVTHLLVSSFPMLHLAFLRAIYQSESKAKAKQQARARARAERRGSHISQPNRQEINFLRTCKGASFSFRLKRSKANRQEGHARPNER